MKVFGLGDHESGNEKCCQRTLKGLDVDLLENFSILGFINFLKLFYIMSETGWAFFWKQIKWHLTGNGRTPETRPFFF